jgi:hypothetical protein
LQIPLGDLEYLTPPTMELLGQHLTFSNARLVRDLDFRPLCSVDEGIRRTLSYYYVSEPATSMAVATMSNAKAATVTTPSTAEIVVCK